MFDFDAHEAAEAARTAAAMVDGRHYSAHAPTVKAMRKAGNDDEAAGLLLRLIEAVEREAAIPLAGGYGVPPWYFDQLAIIYRKAGKKAEAELLMQRYAALDAAATKAGLLLKDEMTRSLLELASGGGTRSATHAPDQQPDAGRTVATGRQRAAAQQAGKWLGKVVGKLWR